MTHESTARKTDKDKGYQPRPENVEGGYQPRAEGPVDPAKLKPPRGDTAAEPPKKPSENE